MRLKPLALGVLGVAALALGGWLLQRTDPRIRPVAEPETAAPAEPGPGTAKVAEVRDRFGFGPAHPLSGIDTREALMARYTPEQQARIDAYYKGYAVGMDFGSKYIARDIFWFSNEAQLRWLLNEGFPTPDEILYAETLSDDALFASAQSGNFKAATFYLDRMTQREGGVVNGVLTGHGALLEDRVLREGTVFGAYVMAKNAQATGKAGHVLAAYQLASLLGDTRASQFKASVAGEPVRAEGALSAFNGLLFRAAKANPQTLNVALAGGRKPFPPH